MHVIDISSSPEPPAHHNVGRAPPAPASKIPIASSRARERVIIDLSDDSSDEASLTPPNNSKCLKPTPLSLTHRGEREIATSGLSMSLDKNIPLLNGNDEMLPLFVLDPVGPKVTTVSRLSASSDSGTVREVLDGTASNAMHIAESDGKLEEERVDEYVAKVLELVPDVEPSYLSTLVLDTFKTSPVDILERAVDALFENPKYPKIERRNKGKRPLDKDDEETAQPGKKTKIDYGDVTRPFTGGVDYVPLAMFQLQMDFPYIPKAYLDQAFRQRKQLYAPTHDFLAMQQYRHEHGNEPLPYIRKTVPFRPSRKGKEKVLRDAAFEQERQWILDQVMPIQTSFEEPHDGVECGCCFTTCPFDQMVQCPETHLFCSSCMTNYASTLLGTLNPDIKCMDQSGCVALIPESELKRFLPDKLQRLWERAKLRKELHSVEIPGLEECPFCDWACIIENESEKLFRCGNEEECGVVSCRSCKKVDHLPKSCKEMEEDKALDGRHAIEEAMSRALVRNCPKCQQPFIKEYGCNKMTCPKCGTYSCYVCRRIINGYDHFTTAPGASTANVCSQSTPQEQLHADEVRKAAEDALQEFKRNNPEVDEGLLKVDVPAAPAIPPPPPLPPMIPLPPIPYQFPIPQPLPPPVDVAQPFHLLPHLPIPPPLPRRAPVRGRKGRRRR